MNLRGIFRFFRNQFPCVRTVTLSSVPAGLAAGYYYASTTSATPPDPTNEAAWTSTTKFDDVGLNDHTTYESHVGDAGSCYIHGLHVAIAPYALGNWTYAANTVGDGSGTAKYWDGAAWQNVTAATNWTHLVATWENVVVDFVAIPGVTYACLTVRDTHGPAPVASIGDSRPSA